MPKLLRIWNWPLHYLILIGMACGALVGWWMGATAVSAIPEATALKDRGRTAASLATRTDLFFILNLVGQMFLDGLKLIIVPIVSSSIILAVATIGSGRDFGRLGAKTLLYYLCTSTIAVLIGLVAVNAIRPGVDAEGRGILVGQDLTAFADDQAAIERRASDSQGRLRSGWDFLNVFRQMVPSNLASAAAENQLLGLITISLIIGFFLSRSETEGARALLRFTEGVYEITLKVTELVLMLAPIGVFALIAVTVAEQYARLYPDARFSAFLTGMLTFAIMTLVALLLHFVGVMGLVLKFLAHVNPMSHYRAMAPALITAFSTASSSATLPVTMECTERRAGVSKRTTGFVVPLGATVNMNGTALYECVAAVFICQAFGVQLTFAQQFMIVVVALLTSVGVAGVPAASLVAIIVILQAVQAQLPPEAPILLAGLGMLFVFDRPLDMCRTAVNIFGDSVGAVVVAKSEGETGVLVPNPEAAQS